MNFYYIPLLLVVLSAYSEGPQHAKPPEPLESSIATICPNSSDVSLGCLAPVLSKHEGFVFVLEGGIAAQIQIGHELTQADGK
jgi:hypothetical protein